MHLHLDPLGGIAGDMFAAALLDAFPELFDDLDQALRQSDLSNIGTVGVSPHGDRALTGTRFTVEATPEEHPHRSLATIEKLLEDSGLEAGVRTRACAIFRLLAAAEGKVHGVPPDEVTFHEVGAWDSILDIVTAAWLIEALRPAIWTCGPLPLGSGTVETAHGPLPVPAPATALLMEGLPCTNDGIPGERVTPTGAAIVHHLVGNGPEDGVRGCRLERNGIGFGTRSLDGVANVLRVMVFSEEESPEGSAAAAERVAVCEFEVDDQTPEDLAVALDRLREEPAVIDVIQIPVTGKKGRLASGIRVIAAPDGLGRTLDACFLETSTLGIRWQFISRAVLPREIDEAEEDGVRVRVKRAVRPDGTATGKAEIDDLATAEGGHAARESLRRRAEASEAGGLRGAASKERDPAPDRD